MMKRSTALLLTLLAAASLTAGCDFELDIEIPIPPHESRLVLNALFETDTTLTVQLGRSLQVGQKGSTRLADGRVELFADGQFVEELRRVVLHEGDHWSEPVVHFVSDYVMQPERTYRLEAEAPGLRPVTAQERTMPLPSFEVVSITHGTPQPHGDREDRVVLRIFDAPGRNYYHLSFPALWVHDSQYSAPPHYTLHPFRSDDPVLQDGQLFDLFDFGAHRYTGAAMFSDATFDGQAYTLTVHVMMPARGHGSSYVPYLRLDSVSEKYYRYVRARQALEDTHGNPFAEPVVLPSNVVGGLGIFAGRSGRNIPLDILAMPTAASR